MPREPELSTAERDFVLLALKSELRTDGRGPFEQRALRVAFGEAFGYAECSLGETRVSASVSAEVVRPRDERPQEGFLAVTSEVSPMASSIYEMGRSSEEEAAITRALDKALRRSGALDTESLCITASKKAWSVRVDVHFLNDAGNLLDCASVAAMAALRHFRKPEVSVEGGEAIIHSVEERVPTPLPLHHSPYCLTFAFFGDGSLMVLDPSHLEQQTATGSLTLTLNPARELCVVLKAGGAPMSTDAVMRVVKVAAQRVRDVDAVVTQALEADNKARGYKLGAY